MEVLSLCIHQLQNLPTEEALEVQEPFGSPLFVTGRCPLNYEETFCVTPAKLEPVKCSGRSWMILVVIFDISTTTDALLFAFPSGPAYDVEMDDLRARGPKEGGILQIYS